MTALTATPRLKFNWGFHDGAADVEHNRPNKWIATSHPSNEYRQGYLSGFNTATRDASTESSDGAWFDALAWGDV